VAGAALPDPSGGGAPASNGSSREASRGSDVERTAHRGGCSKRASKRPIDTPQRLPQPGFVALRAGTVTCCSSFVVLLGRSRRSEGRSGAGAGAASALCRIPLEGSRQH